MDRRRRRAPALGVALTLAATAALAGDAAPPPLKAMLWAPADADPVRAFGTAPPECLGPITDPETRVSVEIGRAAFRSPLVLGGQAARAGLSCESCHRAGRDNPDFLFPGVSGAPGDADVTHSLFSSRRGNGVHDPKPIPDLGGPRDRLKVARADLAGFIRGLVVEEFDGPEPPPAVLAGLAAYVAAMDPAACAQARTPLTAGLFLADARRAVEAALAQEDRDTALVLISAARARLGLIAERFPAPSAEVARLQTADRRLAEAQATLRTGGVPHLRAWLDDSRGLEAGLAAAEPASLFDPDRLAEAAKRRLPPGAS